MSYWTINDTNHVWSKLEIRNDGPTVIGAEGNEAYVILREGKNPFVVTIDQWEFDGDTDCGIIKASISHENCRAFMKHFGTEFWVG